jgi:hypothetical protein
VDRSLAGLPEVEGPLHVRVCLRRA